MSKPKRPTPKPRKQYSNPETLSPPQSPKESLICSTPPPVSPKRWIVRQSSGESEKLEAVKMLAKIIANDACKLNPPPLPAKLHKNKSDDEDENDNEILDDDDALKDWWKGVTPWDQLCKELTLRGGKETKIIKLKAQHLCNAIKYYINLLNEHSGTLQEHIDGLLSIADNLDKVSKGTKIAGITGGATSVAGGVAAAAGVILSPLTLGASLALTVVGVGVAAAGGVTGASAAIANKVSTTQDKKKIQTICNDYKKRTEDIQECLKFINEGMGKLKQHNLSILGETNLKSVRVVRQLVATGGESARVIEANSKASGMIQGFALGMDFFFTNGKDGQKLKKGLESKFAKTIRKLAEGLKDGLDELKEIKITFSEHFPEE